MRFISTAKRLVKRAELWVSLVGLIGLIYGSIWWIRKSAQEAVLDEKFLGTLAAKIRPSCIFDSNGAIEADFGAGDYIEEITVTPGPKKYGYQVTIKAKRHLVYPPLVNGIDVAVLPQSATRGKMYDWTVFVAPNSGTPSLLYDTGSESETNSELHRFRLEILH